MSTARKPEPSIGEAFFDLNGSGSEADLPNRVCFSVFYFTSGWTVCFELYVIDGH